jgi:hypothetical protein
MDGAGRPEDCGALPFEPGVAVLVRGSTHGLDGAGEDGAVRAFDERRLLKSRRREDSTFSNESASVTG